MQVTKQEALSLNVKQMRSAGLAGEWGGVWGRVAQAQAPSTGSSLNPSGIGTLVGGVASGPSLSHCEHAGRTPSPGVIRRARVSSLVQLMSSPAFSGYHRCPSQRRPRKAVQDNRWDVGLWSQTSGVQILV